MIIRVPRRLHVAHTFIDRRDHIIDMKIYSTYRVYEQYSPHSLFWRIYAYNYIHIKQRWLNVFRINCITNHPNPHIQVALYDGQRNETSISSIFVYRLIYQSHWYCWCKESWNLSKHGKFAIDFNWFAGWPHRPHLRSQRHDCRQRNKPSLDGNCWRWCCCWFCFCCCCCWCWCWCCVAGVAEADTKLIDTIWLLKKYMFQGWFDSPVFFLKEL